LQIVTFRAARDILANEELTFFYGSALWFEDTEASLPDTAADGLGIHHDHMDDEEIFLGSITL
jgi:SET domain-containing protein